VKRVLKTLMYMVLMGVLCTWIAALAFPLATKAGMSEAAASRLPNHAFFVGLGLGLLIGLSASVKHVFTSLALMAILCAVFWFYGVLAEGVLIGFGVPPDIVPWVSRIAFGVGVLLCCFTAFVIAREKVEDLVGRRGAKRRARANS
jgi:hypothetical protein